MDGLTAIQELRRMEQSGDIQGHILVLAVTANARAEQLEIVSGCSAFAKIVCLD